MNLRMIHNEPEPEHTTDAEIAAGWAAQALAEGRYELGAALANIARNAARVEARQRPARMVPMLGQTRDERPVSAPAAPHAIYDEVERSGPIPRPVDLGPRCPHGFVADGQACAEFGCIDEQGARFRDALTAVVAMGPTGDGNRDVPELGRASEAQTELFGRPVEPDTSAALPGGRCIAVVEQDGPAGVSNTATCHNVIFWEPGRIGDEHAAPIPAGWRHLNPELDQHHAPVPQQG